MTETESEFFRETRKLEIRLNEYLKEEDVFVNKLRDSIGQLKALNTAIEQLHAPISGEKAEEILKLKAEAITALSEALKIQGKAEHEKSHLLESYGALLVELQKTGTEQ
jgi:hypothetical protein